MRPKWDEVKAAWAKGELSDEIGWVEGRVQYRFQRVVEGEYYSRLYGEGLDTGVVAYTRINLRWATAQEFDNAVTNLYAACSAYRVTYEMGGRPTIEMVRLVNGKNSPDPLPIFIWREGDATMEADPSYYSTSAKVKYPDGRDATDSYYEAKGVTWDEFLDVLKTKGEIPEERAARQRREAEEREQKRLADERERVATLRTREWVFVSFSGNWADEMDVSGFSIMTGEDFGKWYDSAAAVTRSWEYSIGTNEDLEFDNGRDYLNDFEFKAISPADRLTIMEFFGSNGGVFPDLPGDGDDEDD